MKQRLLFLISAAFFLNSIFALNFSERDFTKTNIVYSQKYDISFFGIERFLHHFDSHKYSKVFSHLSKKGLLSGEKGHSSLNVVHTPQPVTDADLLKIHTKDYLESLKNSAVVADTVGIAPLGYVPNVILQSNLLTPMRHATGGTILAAKIAMERGVAINLSGGYHHAKADISEGFCFFADIPLAINNLWNENPELKVLIIDLDAHQGNGVSTIVGDDKRVCIIDAFGKYNYPRGHDRKATDHVRYPIQLEWHTDDTTYLSLLKQPLKEALAEHKPDLVIYNAGTDILEKDPLGRMNVTKAGIIARDELVFKSAIDQKIPFMMVLSGGYTQESADVIASSIENMMMHQR